MSWRPARSRSIVFLLVHLADFESFAFQFFHQRHRGSCSKTLDLSSLKHRGNLEMIFAVQGIAECQSPLSNPPGLSLWSHLELTESTTGRNSGNSGKSQISLPASQPDGHKPGLFCTCAGRKCFYQARKQHGECKKSFFHRVDDGENSSTFISYWYVLTWTSQSHFSPKQSATKKKKSLHRPVLKSIFLLLPWFWVHQAS